MWTRPALSCVPRKQDTGEGAARGAVHGIGHKLRSGLRISRPLRLHVEPGAPASRKNPGSQEIGVQSWWEH